MTAPRLLPLALVLALTACDQPAPRTIKRAPVPQPSLPVDKPVAPTTRAQPITWDASDGTFRVGATPLKSVRMWTFDGATDGFVLTGGLTGLAQNAGLRLSNQAPDPALRSPRGLEINGARGSLVLVRLTRKQASPAWDGSLYYSTAGHGESQGFFAKPVMGGSPAVNETLILAYDMAHPTGGGDDWTTSLISQIRLDTDDSPGGAFVIRQIAVTENPGREALGLAAAPVKTPPVKSETKAAAKP
ncbi:MAG: hypothetical protein KA085_12775 [Phenylobacterium sp.]|uniref:hypothetical protein n=1 Tax=Phenylobacterium sp. TaxID=1871053 RepID=UPI001B542F02|nr:hypothetical protein [Phenylobacterium sp.]MBP7649988.1 hypothetical protein [Phenylobacterium sp.]MBP7816997.1 hypothetical protein [Phenylobacterium sp.]MBP9230388.1 hypothetical protein [Phenylobacterium sp.]MBP9756636.1 hypothetical protein [Phenylobacterium sp.]